jgi:hypothetical protein
VAVGAAALVAVLVGGSLWASTRLHGPPWLHEAAMFAHLAGLVLGFGAVLAVDWVGLLWALRCRPLAAVLRAADNATTPIWLGYAALVVSGALLGPDLSSPMTRLKVALVVVIGWNGVAASLLKPALARAGRRAPARRLLLASGAAALVSQAGWWGAMVIGFLNAR